MSAISKTIILERTMFKPGTWDQLCDKFYAANSQGVDSLVLVVSDYHVQRTRIQQQLSPGRVEIKRKLMKEHRR